MSQYGIRLKHPIFSGPPGLAGLLAGLGDATGELTCPAGICYSPYMVPQSSLGANTRAGFVATMQSAVGLDPAVSSGGRATATTLGSYYPSSYPVAWEPDSVIPGGCRNQQGGYPCVHPFTDAQLSQTWDPGTFFDMVTAAINAGMATFLAAEGTGPLPTPASLISVSTPNATTATDTPAGVMPGESQPSPVSGSSGGASSNQSQPAAAAACSFALFGDTSCFSIGSTTIGTTTALVLGAAALALMLMLGGKK